MTAPLHEALAEAVRRLADLEKRGSQPLAITNATRHETGWVFHYNSARYLESRVFTDLLGGNAPIVVPDNAEAIFVSTADDIAKYVGASIYDPQQGMP